MFFMPLVNFFVVFCVIWIAYVCIFFALFNDSMYGGSTFLKAIETTYLMILHKFNSQDMVANQPILGPIVFLSYMLIVSIIMANFMVVIIVIEYERIKADFKARYGDDDAVVWEFFKTQASRFTESTRQRFGKNKKRVKKEAADYQEATDSLSLFKEKTTEFADYVAHYREGVEVIEDDSVEAGFVSRLGVKLGRKKKYQVASS
jgi:hypothetical protein